MIDLEQRFDTVEAISDNATFEADKWFQIDMTFLVD